MWWMALLLAALGGGRTLQGQLAVVNGSFTNLTGLTSTGGGWYGATGNAPDGWTGSGNSPYSLSVNGSHYLVNLGAFSGSTLSQTVGATPRSGAVVLFFDDSPFNGNPGHMTVSIQDGIGNTLATDTFSAGWQQNLVADNVPAGTTIVIQFVDDGQQSGLGNVSVMMPDPSLPPLITQQPGAHYALPPATAAALSVAAVGIPPLTYQWQSNGIALAGANTAALTVANPGNYTVVVTGGNSLSVTSAVAQIIRSNVAPILNGDFTAGHLPGWGGTWASLTTPNASSGWDGSSSGGALNQDRFGIWTVFLAQYSPKYDLNLNLTGPAIVIVSFKAGYADQSGTSITASLTVGGTPISQTFTIGKTLDSYVAVFTNTSATGDTVLGFTGDASFLTDVSGIGFFSATDKPVITQQPPDWQLSFLGGTVNFSVQALGFPPLTYQWQTNGVALSGQTSASLTISNLTGANNGNYTVVVTGGNGLSATSAVAQVVIPTTPPITVIYDPMNAAAGTSLNGTTPHSRGGTGRQPWGAGTNLVMNGATLTEAHASDSAFVPFVPDARNIYMLTCEMNIMTGNWIGIAYSQNANVTNYSGFYTSGNNLAGWFAQVIDQVTPANSGDAFCVSGPDLAGWTFGTLPKIYVANQVYTNTVVLDTTGANWTFTFMVDGVAIDGPMVYSQTTGVNPVINYVGLGNSDISYEPNGQTATFANFKVQSVLPRIIPALSIVKQTGSYNLSWPTTAGGWELDTAPSLTSPSWTPVAGVSNNSATVSAGTGNAFCRLRSAY